LKQNENSVDYMFLDVETIQIREQVEKYGYHWKWFVLGLLLAIIGAFIYLRYTANEYQVSAIILIDDESGGGMPSELAPFEELGLMGNTKKNIENEIGILKSRNLMRRVVVELDANVNYFTQGRIRAVEVHMDELPFKITFFSKDSLFYQTDTTFSIQVLSNDKVKLSSFDRSSHREYSFGKNINTKFGDLTITPMNQSAIDYNLEFIVKISPLKIAIQKLRNAVAVNLLSKQSSLLELKLNGTVKLKSQEILNELIRQYNTDAIEYKSMIGNNTNTFINERLLVIEKELSKVDSSEEEFKTTNKLMDIPAEADLILVNNSELEKKIVDLNTQLKLVDYVNTFITETKEKMIPANLGLRNGEVNSNSDRYNQVLLEYTRIAKSSGKKNPVIINLSVQLDQLKESIIQSLVNLKSSLEISLNEATAQERSLREKISAAPRQEREYRVIQRQQQIIETLYLFLLEKREENAISLAVTTPNAKLIDAADGSSKPVRPKRKIVYITAFFIGILIPFAIIHMSFLLDNKVQTHKELVDVVKAPFLGDIPKVSDENKIILNKDRGSMAEAFRMLRTNMNFMLSNENEGSKAVYITSTITKEGKTFVAINLATVLALSNKKVLLIGADIRKPKLAEYLNMPSMEKGLSLFLADASIQIQEIIETVEDAQFDIIQSGIIPPNPSELLMNGRIDEVLAYAKEHYDYVIVDTAPINMVTDTLQLAQKADLFLYVVRANYIDKRLLEIPKKLYADKRLTNMALILNGSDANRGYGYGYGYGYGQEKVKKSWFKKQM
jgi:tyrosine-protein kinase Etk/Wzc